LPFDDHQVPLYTVGQVAQMLDVQPAFLRRLDSEQVLQPARSDGGQRRYSRDQVALVGRISDLIEEGLTLSGIRQVIMLQDQVAHLQAELAAERARNKRA
jgi:DNA-binding transcriptional MerR regulator